MERPKINPPLSLFDKFFEVLAAVALVYAIAQIMYEYPDLPGQIPTHFGAEGRADTWGNKTSVLILLLVGIVLYAGLTAINFFPYIFNFPVRLTESNAIRQYRLAKSMIITLKFVIVAIFTYIQVKTVEIAQGAARDLGEFFTIAVLAGTFLPIVVYFILAVKSK